MSQADNAKPLSGLKVLEISSLAAPWATTLLAAYGADVIVIEPPKAIEVVDVMRTTGFGRGKRSIAIDLKHQEAASLVLEMIDKSDVFVEAMRPGKAEQLGLGPDTVHARAPHVIYTRFSNYGQGGALSAKAGHDINVIALSGLLGQVGLDQPLPPQAMMGDFASGGLMIVIGVLLAHIERQRTGKGQVVDAAMLDGAATLVGPFIELFKNGQIGPRGSNLLDGSRPYYTTYQCKDGKWLAVGPIEPKFFAQFVSGLGLEDQIRIEDQYKWTHDEGQKIKSLIAEKIEQRSRDHWVEAFENYDACVTPVLEIDEVHQYPANIERGVFGLGEDGPRSHAAPRMGGRIFTSSDKIPQRGQDTQQVLAEFGFDPAFIDQAVESGLVGPKT